MQSVAVTLFLWLQKQSISIENKENGYSDVTRSMDSTATDDSVWL